MTHTSSDCGSIRNYNLDTSITATLANFVSSLTFNGFCLCVLEQSELAQWKGPQLINAPDLDKGHLASTSTDCL